MSTLNPPRKISKRHELREDAVVTTYARAWEYFDQHRQLVYGVLAGLVLVVLGIIGFMFYRHAQAGEAQELLGRVVGIYEAGNYREALDGTGEMTGLLEIADEYGGTDAGNLARFYAADALYTLGEYDEALRYFEAYDGQDDIIGASATAGAAAVYENRGEFERAGDLYRRAARQYESELMSPQYLLFAGRAYEEAGAFDEAREAYSLIRDDYPASSAAGNVETYLARVDAKSE